MVGEILWAMAGWDDDDWVGEPPEGRHSRDRAKPEFWRGHWQEAVALSVLGIVALIALVIILLAGCGGDSDDGSSARDDRTVLTTGSGGLEPGAVGIADFLFDPAHTKVERGARVTWVNTGAEAHTVKGEGFESARLAAGDSYRHRFDKAGTYSYVCGIHPRMKGTVAVM